MIQWPHSPVHEFTPGCTYMVTAATAKKQHFFRGSEPLTFLTSTLLEEAVKGGWRLEAWAIFPNDYHFIGVAPNDGGLTIAALIKSVHSRTARWINERDGTIGREVWYQYWDTKLTFEKSYLARLHYVHANPVRHGLAVDARDYEWCSMGWFRENAPFERVRMVTSFKTDRVSVPDDF